MVQTRRSAKKPVKIPLIQTTIKENRVGKWKNTQNNLDRCKIWVQQQKKEKKEKVQPDDLNSNESDDEVRDLNLASISVS